MMKIAFVTELNFFGKIPRTHDNMRTEFAWMSALNADNIYINDLIFNKTMLDIAEKIIVVNDCSTEKEYYEYDWCEKENKRTWEHNEGYPFLAKRDLKYNIFKRFIKRQVKTFKRLKNFLIKLKLERWPSG